jgi:hypothetical protein
MKKKKRAKQLTEKKIWRKDLLKNWSRKAHKRNKLEKSLIDSHEEKQGLT